MPALSYRTAVQLDPGLSAVVRLTVAPSDAADALGTGSVPVLATPRLIALCEEATCLALSGALPDGCTSVAGRVQFDHLTPVRIGSVVTAEATLERVEGRRLVFTVSAIDASGLVGAGRITRVVVREQPFLDKAR